MRRKLPPMNALLAFESAARHLSFTRAADELSVAQPAVTRHISNVANWLGTDVFTRRGNTVQLTKEGERLAELATAALDRLELGIRDLKPDNKNELVIGASFGVAHLWLMPRISTMRTAAGTNINLVTSDDYRTFDEPSVDLSIRFGNGAFDGKCADLLFAERCQIIAAPAFIEANPEFDPEKPSDTVAPEVLLDHGDPNKVGWMDWELWHELSGIPFPGTNRLTKVESYPTMLDMVCAGEGISIGTLGIEDDLVASGTLVCLGPSVARARFGYYLVYRKDKLRDQAFQRLRRLLLESGTDLQTEE